MINTNKLRGLIAERGLSQVKVAEILGVTQKHFTQKWREAYLIPTRSKR